MSNDELERASEHLRAAADRSDDADQRERIERIADQLDRLTGADRGPDHGRLARFENALLEITDGANDDVAEEVTDAHGLLKQYRSGVEGV